MIGVCDSGLGGILLLAQIHKDYPLTDILFHGDSEHMPYGNKTVDQLRAIFADIVRTFKDHGCTDIVIACNTLCSIVDFSKDYGIKIHDIIAPTVEQIDVLKSKKIVVFQTTMTKKCRRYEKELIKRGYEHIELIDLPFLAQDIERFTAKDILKTKLHPVFAKIDTTDLGAVVLGCTHYPVVKDIFQEYFKVPIYDSNHLSYNLDPKSESGKISLMMPRSSDLDRFMRELGKVEYCYEEDRLSI